MHRTRHDRAFSVLVGDDDRAVRECVTEVLVDQGFRVHAVASGTNALRTLLREAIDFSILDVEMPEMSGIQVLRAYLDGPWIAGAAGPATRGVRRRMPTIFMSGNPAREIRLTCESMGSSFLDKPFAATDMRAAIDRVLAEHLLRGS